MVRARVAVLSALALCVLGAKATTNHPIPVSDAPLDRVIPNLERQAKITPNDSRVQYRLGRAHALAFVTKRDTIRGWGEPESNLEPLSPGTQDWDLRGDANRELGKPLSEAEVKDHLAKSVAHLAQAIRAKREPRYYVALASVLETAGQEAVDLDVTKVLPPEGDRGVETSRDGVKVPRARAQISNLTH